MKQKIKIGVLLNSNLIPFWQYEVLKDLCSSDYAQISSLIINDSQSSSSVNNGRSLTYYLAKLLERADSLIFNGDQEYNIKKDIVSLPGNIPVLSIEQGNRLPIEDYNDTIISELKVLNPDIIIKFGIHTINEDLIQIPRYGVWSYSFDEYEHKDAIRPGFWEVLNSCPVTRSSLEIVKAYPGKREIIFNSWESTCPYSINRNRNIVAWRAKLFIPRIIRGLYEVGNDFFIALKDKYKKSSPQEEGLSTCPALSTTSASIFNYFGIAARYIRKNIIYTYDFSWSLLYKINKDGNFSSKGFNNFREIKPPNGVYWADPFVLAQNDGYLIFVEEFIYKFHKAHISVLKLDGDGKLLNSKRIIERPYHMSYPFIFMMDGTYYMIPETSKNRTIELYKCIDFPYNWQFCMNLMENLSAVDTTLYYYNNKWWLFTSVDQTDNISGCSTELFLFNAVDIFSSKWISHPLNPIISDSRSARPAGKIFIRDGKIFRPSQDCTIRYGRGFRINQVTKLTDTEYEEIVVSETEPIWDPKLKGTHTFNFDRGFTVIDVYSFRRRTD